MNPAYVILSLIKFHCHNKIPTKSMVNFTFKVDFVVVLLMINKKMSLDLRFEIKIQSKIAK